MENKESQAIVSFLLFKKIFISWEHISLQESKFLFSVNA